MFLNVSSPNLNNSSTVELDDSINNLRSNSRSTQIQQTNIISSNNAQQSMGTTQMGSNSNLSNKITIGIQKNSVATPCKLCGNGLSTMRCSDCIMQFCYACDNMYHRHPKRKHHIRKSINLVS